MTHSDIKTLEKVNRNLFNIKLSRFFLASVQHKKQKLFKRGFLELEDFQSSMLLFSHKSTEPSSTMQYLFKAFPQSMACIEIMIDMANISFTKPKV